MMLYPFRFRDPVSGKWKRAHYVAERHVIAERFAEFEIVGPPEVREMDPQARPFSPHGNPRAHSPIDDPPPKQPPSPEKEPPGKDPPVKEPPEKDPSPMDPPSEDPSALDDRERFLLLVFLRRYVTYCARRRRFEAMNGAARLFAQVGGVRVASAMDPGAGTGDRA